MAEGPPPPPGAEQPEVLSPPQPDGLNQPQLDGQQPQPVEEAQVQPGEQAPGEQAPPGEQPQQPRVELVPDGSHSWKVAVAAAWNIFCCSLLRRAMPVMFPAVGDAFATSSKGVVAWMNAFIYSLAYTLSPVVTVQCRTVPLKVLSIGGAMLVGVGPIMCFFFGSLTLMVPAIGICCGLGAALSTVVNETVVHLHFNAERRKAMSISRAAFSLSAMAYPLVLALLVSVYGLDGALLVSGAISLNALAGSLLMARPPWMSPSDPMPSIHRPEGADDHPAAELEQGIKGDASEKPDASKMSVAAEDPSTAGNHPGLVSGGASGATSVDPGTMGDGTAAQSEGMEPHPDGEQPAGQLPEGTAAEPNKVASPTGVVGATRDSTVARTLAAHSALTSLSVTAGALIYDYAMDGDPVRAPSATLALLSYGAGDLVGRMCYETLLSTGEHRKVMAVQAFLQGGVLFLMAMTNEVFLLAPVGFGLGGISSTLDLLPVPVLQRFAEPDSVERQLGICRAASGIGCLLGPVFVMVFRDGEMQSYVVVFILSGLLSIIAGILWLPGIKKEMDEARGKTTAYPKTEPVAAEPGAAEPGAAEPGAAEPGAAEPGAAELSPPLPGALELAAGEPVPGEPGAPPDAAEPGAQMPAADPAAMA